jgi:hypothetical protein
MTEKNQKNSLMVSSANFLAFSCDEAIEAWNALSEVVHPLGDDYPVFRRTRYNDAAPSRVEAYSKPSEA